MITSTPPPPTRRLHITGSSSTLGLIWMWDGKFVYSALPRTPVTLFSSRNAIVTGSVTSITPTPSLSSRPGRRSGAPLLLLDGTSELLVLGQHETIYYCRCICKKIDLHTGAASKYGDKKPNSYVLKYCLAVNADSISNLRSELGNQLANKSRKLKLRGIGAVVYKVPELNNDQMLKISLRSVDSEDTTSISQEYGGGGHRNASSFMLTVAEFERCKVGAEPSNTTTA